MSVYLHEYLLDVTYLFIYSLYSEYTAGNDDLKFWLSSMHASFEMDECNEGSLYLYVQRISIVILLACRHMCACIIVYKICVWYNI